MSSNPTPSGRPLLDRLRAAGDQDAGPADGNQDRILQTALEEITEGGLRRFTVDRLAKRVGLSRVTLYRYFPGKEGILEAVLMRELRRFMTQVGEVVARYDTLDQRVVEGFIFALTWLRQHALLNRLLRKEPELILPLLTTHGTPVVTAARDFIVSFAREGDQSGLVQLDSQELQVLSEMLARLILSLVLTPESSVELQSEEQIRAVAETYVGPVIRAFTSTAVNP